MANVNNKIQLEEIIKFNNGTGVIKDYKDSTDPKYIGPGTWNVIHRTAFAAKTHKLQICFIKNMKQICTGFPCTVCRNHCTEYIKNHPMEDYLDAVLEVNGKKIILGMFVWSWKFHNAVNARINKPIMSWDTAYNLYSVDEPLVCSKSCLEADDNVIDGAENKLTPISSLYNIAPEYNYKVPGPVNITPSSKLFTKLK